MIVGLGGVAGLSGLILLRVRRTPEPILGAVAVLGTGTGITLSLGMATADVGEATSLEELWAATDAAMYDVKRAGGDAVGIAPRGPDPPSR